jgi:hypothetical protein
MTKSSTQEVATGQPFVGMAAPAVPASVKGLRLWRGNDGRLWGQSNLEPEARAVRVCRLFPWSEPREWVSLRDADDEELALVRAPAELDPESRGALEISLAEAGFVMEIEAILSVEEEIEIRTFEVRTAQGPRSFQTERDEWPRQLGTGGLLIRDVAGDLYAVREPEKLDPVSRKLLWVFLD